MSIFVNGVESKKTWQAFRKSNNFYTSSPIAGGTTSAIVANTLYAVPFYVDNSITITKIAMHVTTLGGGNARLGIYNDNGSIYPGSLLLDAGTIDVSSTGLKTISSLSVSLNEKSLYWLSMVSNVIFTTAIHQTQSQWGILGFSTALNVVANSSYHVAFSYAGLPNPFTVGATEENDQIRIAVG